MGVRSQAQSVVDEVVAICRQDEIVATQGDWITCGDDFCEAVVSFEGVYADGFRILSRVMAANFPVVSLRRAWVVVEGEPRGPRWEIVLGPFES